MTKRKPNPIHSTPTGIEQLDRNGNPSPDVRIPLRDTDRRPDETQAQFFRRLERQGVRTNE